MGKFIADSMYRMTDVDDNAVISFVVRGMDKRAALMAFDEVNKGLKIEIDVKPYRGKRSIEQNKLLWALLGKMAMAMSGNRRKVSSEECYCIMLEEANVAYDYLLALPETEPILKKTFRVIRKIGEREVNGKILNVYQYFIGSSKYTTKEMTELIEAVLDKLAELGVYDSEIAVAREEYRRG